MNNIFKILVMSSFVAFQTVNAQTKTVKQVNPLATFIVGTWKVTSVDGQMFIKMNPKSNAEMPVPLGLWVGKNFVFSKDNQLVIKDAGKTYFTGAYVLTDNKISVPKTAGNFEMIIEKDGSNLKISQTPNTFYSLLTEQSKQSVEQVKKMFRIPKNIVFNMSK
ncbi:hypothetical protein [Chryseobacterium sp. T1]